MTSENSRCKFVALLGTPNVGKSTLLNWLVGTKISIVTPKVQTTRTRVIGIVMRGDVQIVFIDTPGIFLPKQRLHRAMVEAAWSGARQADNIILLVDANTGLTEDTDRVLVKLKTQNRPVIVALIRNCRTFGNHHVPQDWVKRTNGDFIVGKTDSIEIKKLRDLINKTK